MAEGVSRSSSVGDDEEVFEITDFTNVSDWEKFVAQISEAVCDWQLTCIEHVKPLEKKELTMGAWEQVNKEIRFSNATFMLTLYQLKQSGGDDIYFEESENSLEDELHLPAYMDDMMSINNDFPPRAHCLVRWYGFRSFLVLSLISSGTKGVDDLTSESKCNLLLSSACIVLSDSGCEVPIFIQIQQNWRKMFTGRCIGTGMQTEFEMVHLKKCPPQYRHLSGLLHVFKSKIGRPITPVQISARFTYVLSNWGEKGLWPQEQIDTDVAAQTLDRFQFGCLEDPINDLHLSALWPSITEDLIIENDVHSDFNPAAAPVWAVKLLYTDDPECLLSGYLKEMLKLRLCTDTFTSLVKTAAKAQDPSQDIGKALSKLTDSSHKVKQMVPLMPGLTSGISKMVTTPRSMLTKRMKYAQYTTVGPITQSMMELMMDFLLPEEEPQNDAETVPKNTALVDQRGSFTHEIEHQIKSAPQNSLTYRLATCLTVANYCHGGIAAIAQVWNEFVQEMRYRFENGILITGIKAGNPDLRCCLLHQKLQMLNSCIQHKLTREEHQNQSFDIVEEDSSQPESSAWQKDDDLQQHSIVPRNDSKKTPGSPSAGGESDHAEDLHSSNQEETSSQDPQSSNQGELSSEDPQLCNQEELSSQDPQSFNQEELSSANQKSDFRADREITRIESDVSIESRSRTASGGAGSRTTSIEDEFFDCDEGESDSAAGSGKEDGGSVDTGETSASPVVTDDAGAAENQEPDSTTQEGSEDVVGLSEQLPNEDAANAEVSGDVDTTMDTHASSVEVPTDPDAKPVGRLEQFEGKNLLHYEVPLFVPVTQEPAPLTEDVLEEQTKIFSSLGDSAEGALLRRKMQSASLSSDMESFKAANPGCVLADFVRWYSPRDFEEKDEGGTVFGSLSERMKIPGNLWQTMWDTAKPIPARRQKRLFDDTKEGEKVLHFLSSLQPKDMVMLLLPVCFHESIRLLKENSDVNLLSVPTLCGQILTQTCRLFQGNYRDKFAQMDDIFQKIIFTETLIERAVSLKHKFAKAKGVDAFVRQLLENPEVVLEGSANGNIGHIVKQYFLDQGNAAAHVYSMGAEPAARVTALPPPSGREYILRCTAPRPSAQSRPLPHKLYAVLIKNEFRLAGAFSSDTVFF